MKKKDKEKIIQMFMQYENKTREEAEKIIKEAEEEAKRQIENEKKNNK